MTKERLNELQRVTGKLVPEAMDEHIGDLESTETELLPREMLLTVLDENRVPEDRKLPLLDALDAVNAVPELVELAHIMARDAVRGLVRCHAVEFYQPKPKCLSGFAREAYAFLYTQLCVLEGRKALRKRGIPETYDRDIPERMTRKQLKKYTESGDISFDDYPWDMNFYCCQIFFLNRFYFIPYRWGDAPAAWRNRETGKVTALWRAGDRIRKDGQPDGVNGVTETTIRLTFTDGVQTDAVITGEKVITEAVNEQKTVGSANGTKSKTSTGSGSSTGAFMWPVPHTHNITSYMEWRWGRMHNGLDIAGGDDYGQPILASDGGVVTFAGNDGGGYGNYVMIDHGNGYMTVYGHASEICCTTGQYVNQGDTIALIGSTGNSTGPHLHFEIRLNGEYQQNPLNYVS